ncbi:MAG: hypothetical protein WAV02_05250 [Stellaceae bacterium]
MRRFSMLAALLLLAGCVDYTHAEFVTNQAVDLHLSQSHDATVTAHVPRGTPVARLGWAGSECECWLVATPYGDGFIYTRYLDLHLADIAP